MTVESQSDLKGSIMPKKTFKNLPEEKRQLIEDIAIREFGVFGYPNFLYFLIKSPDFTPFSSI